MIKPHFKQLIGGLLLSITLFNVQAASLTGAGASFPYPIYAKWASDYKNATGNTVNYQSIGSAGGQQKIIAKIVDFGASDDPLSAADLKKYGLLQFPAVVGGIVPVVNLSGLKPGQLKLSGPLLADIFLGKIKKWNDPAIQKLNPALSAQLPNADIIVIHRSDGSGTTFGWTCYLSQVSADWKTRVGVGKSVKWPAGQGGKGNEGVAAYVAQLKNAIGYVEYAYAKQNTLTWTQLQNQAGQFVSPDQTAFAAAAAHADWRNTPGMGVLLINDTAPQSWPITAATFILIQQNQDRPETGKAILSFFDWAFKNGAAAAITLDYAPLPKHVTQEISSLWQKELKTTAGQPIWP